MTYQIRKAMKSEAKPLIGLYSESGKGKTLSALYMAKGFAGDGRIVMIETEGGRGEAYVNSKEFPYEYDVIPVRETFSPKCYGEAITVAERVHPAVLIIDSASHEWEGAGGVLSMAAKNQEDGKKGPLVWQRPKMDHQEHFMLRIMQTPIPLVIVNMRAKYVMEEKMVSGKKEWSRSENLSPKQSEDILFEMFVHGWIDGEHRFHATKYTLSELRDIIRDNEPISVETGTRLSAWSAGNLKPQDRTPALNPPPSTQAGDPAVSFLTPDMIIDIEDKAKDKGITTRKIASAYGVTSLQQVPRDKYKEILDRISKSTGK